MQVMAANFKEQREFAKWVLNVGNDSLPTIVEKKRCRSRLDQDYVPYEATSKRLQLKKINLNHLSKSPTPLWRCHVSYAMQHSGPQKY